MKRHKGQGLPSGGPAGNVERGLCKVSHSEDRAIDRKERRHRETREEILREARRLVEEKGANNLALREVAKNTGFTPPALYRYFPRGKDEVLESLAVSSLGLLFQHFDRVPIDLPPEQRLLELAMAYMEFAREHRRELDLMLDTVGAVEAHDPQADVFLDSQGIFSSLREALSEAAEAGVIRASSDTELALVFHGAWSLLHGMAVIEAVHPRHEELFRVHARDLMRAFIKGIATDWLGEHPASHPSSD